MVSAPQARIKRARAVVMRRERGVTTPLTQQRPLIDSLPLFAQELTCLPDQTARQRIPQPVGLDHLLPVYPYAEFEQPPFYHFHLYVILRLQLFRHTGGNIFLGGSHGAVSNFYLSRHVLLLRSGVGVKEQLYLYGCRAKHV